MNCKSIYSNIFVPSFWVKSLHKFNKRLLSSFTSRKRNKFFRTLNHKKMTFADKKFSPKSTAMLETGCGSVKLPSFVKGRTLITFVF